MTSRKSLDCITILVDASCCLVKDGLGRKYINFTVPFVVPVIDKSLCLAFVYYFGLPSAWKKW